MSEGELKEWLERANEASGELKILSEVQSVACKLETEARCWQFLETRLSLLLAQYKTLEEEECKLLTSDGISHHQKLCVLLKRAERKLLRNALNYTAASKNKVSGSQIERSKSSDTKPHNMSSDCDGTIPVNTSTSDGMDETTSAVNQLVIHGDQA